MTDAAARSVATAVVQASVALVGGSVGLILAMVAAVAGHYRLHRPIRLGKDEYFLLGDNSYLSNDSRALGPVGRRKLSGKVVFRFAPLDRIGPIR